MRTEPAEEVHARSRVQYINCSSRTFFINLYFKCVFCLLGPQASLQFGPQSPSARVREVLLYNNIFNLVRT